MIIPKTKIISSGKTKGKILGVAKKLFIKYGYAGVSMRDIAKRVKITKAALYYHFRSKREICLETLQQYFGVLSGLLEKVFNSTETFEKKLRRTLIVYLEFSFREKNSVSGIFQRITKLDNKAINVAKKLQFQIIKEFELLIKEGQKKKKILTNLSSKTITRLIFGMMDASIVQENSVGHNGKGAKKIADEIINLVSIHKK